MGKSKQHIPTNIYNILSACGKANTNVKSTSVILETSISPSKSEHPGTQCALGRPLVTFSLLCGSQRRITTIWSLHTSKGTKHLWHLQTTSQQGAPCHTVVRRVRMSGQIGDATSNLLSTIDANREEEKKWSEFRWSCLWSSSRHERKVCDTGAVETFIDKSPLKSAFSTWWGLACGCLPTCLFFVFWNEFTWRTVSKITFRIWIGAKNCLDKPAFINFPDTWVQHNKVI